MTRLMFPSLALTVLVLSAACSRAEADVREWKASDHDHTAEPSAGQSAPDQQKTSSASGAGDHGIDEVTLVAWKQNCVTCHGLIGAGDGPQSAAVGARNLTDPAWQASVTDEQIAAAIRSGKGTMPAFALPDSTVTGLVKLVRLLNPEGRPQTQASAGTDAGAAHAERPAPAAPATSAQRSGAARGTESNSGQ